MARSSWLDDEATERTYLFREGFRWVVRNEYRPIGCPKCRHVQYLRLTRIWHRDSQGTRGPECHLNENIDIEELKRLLITYVDGVGITESEVGGTWALMKGDAIIAHQEI